MIVVSSEGIWIARDASDGTCHEALFPIGAIVGGLFGDDDVVHMAFAKPGKSLPDKRRLLLQIRNGFTSAIAHAGFHSADHLVNMRRQKPLVRDSTFNPFGHQFWSGTPGLSIPISTATLHGADRSQA